MALSPSRRFVAGQDELPAPPPGWDGFETIMALALDHAREAAALGEAPVGAVVLSAGGDLLGAAGNAPISRSDPSAHAEILALRQAARAVGNYRLPGTILAVTLEPCLMCLGAMLHARVGLVVYGASDPRTGAITSRLPGPDLPFSNHRFDVIAGVLESACGSVLREFFRTRRLRADASADK